MSSILRGAGCVKTQARKPDGTVYIKYRRQPRDFFLAPPSICWCGSRTVDTAAQDVPIVSPRAVASSNIFLGALWRHGLRRRPRLHEPPVALAAG
eukprot:8196837-Pyramimonas_sp.AAC.1